MIDRKEISCVEASYIFLAIIMKKSIIKVRERHITSRVSLDEEGIIISIHNIGELRLFWKSVQG